MPTNGDVPVPLLLSTVIPDTVLPVRSSVASLVTILPLVNPKIEVKRDKVLFDKTALGFVA